MNINFECIVTLFNAVYQSNGMSHCWTLRREADRSPPRSAEVNNAWSCTFTSPRVLIVWYLGIQTDNFTIFFLNFYNAESYPIPFCTKWLSFNILYGCNCLLPIQI